MPKSSSIPNIKFKHVSVLSGYERTVFLIILMAISTLFGGIWAIAGTGIDQIIGIAVLGFGLFGIVGFFVKQYVFTTNKGFVLSICIQFARLLVPDTGNVWFRNYEDITEIPIMEELSESLRPEDQLLPAELQKSLGESKEKNPQHHYVRIRCELGFFVGEIDFLLQASPENVFIHHPVSYPIVGAYPRWFANLEIASGEFRGFREWTEPFEGNKLQKFAQKIRIKKYPKIVPKRALIIYITDSSLHRTYPEVAIKAKQMTPELEMRYATLVLARDARDYIGEIKQAWEAADSEAELKEKKLEVAYKVPPSITQTVNPTGRKLSNAKFVVVFLVILVGISMLWLFYTNAMVIGESPDGDFRLKNIKPETLEQHLIAGWEIVGILPNGEYVVKIEQSRLQQIQEAERQQQAQNQSRGR